MKNSMSAVGGACCTCGGEERRIQGFGKSEGKRPLGRHWRKWEDNIKMDLQEVGWGAYTESIWLRTGTGGGLL